jgi:peptide/nickel transport system permease protein
MSRAESLSVELPARRKGRPSLSFKTWTHSKVTFVAELILLVMVIIAIIGPYIAPFDPLQISLRERLQPPSPAHPMGTDQQGRDILSRMMAGTRITLTTVAAVLILVAVAGVVVGAVSGYAGGRWDDLLMRICDLVLAFPALVLAMALAATMGAGLTSAVIAVALVRWPRYARLVRGQVLTLKNKPFVEAARAIGATSVRVLFRHILLNTWDPIIVRATVDAGYVILVTASLGFIGLGARPPIPEWGAMVADGRTYLLNSPWVALFPGLGIMLAVLAITLVGDELRDRLDPTLRGFFN